MNATQRAMAAYGTGAQPIRTPRGIEYEAFARVTRRLKSANPQSKARFADLAGAVHDNRKLWTLLAVDAVDQNNGLPKELRARILYLAEFTRIHSGKVLKSGAPTDPLVDINTAIMRGLQDRRPVS